MKEKFTDKDRILIIQELEKIQQTQIEQIKPSRKLFRDSRGLLYLISGGTEDWHGINANIMEQLKNLNKESAFIVAKKYQTRIEIYAGSLIEFIKTKDKLVKTKQGSYQFHCVLTGNGLYIEEDNNFFCNLIHTIQFPDSKKHFNRLKEISKIINIEIQDDVQLSHADIQAKLLLIGSYLNYRTYTPDQSKMSEIFNKKLGELCSEKQIPEGAIPSLSVDTVKFVDVIWFDEEGYPTHAFEVEHTTDITKGLLRLYQIHKLRIKMFVIADETNRDKFNREIAKNPFIKIKNEFIFKNYNELDEFFESVKSFSKLHEKFLGF
jgi:hypothetical protein